MDWPNKTLISPPVSVIFRKSNSSTLIKQLPPSKTSYFYPKKNSNLSAQFSSTSTWLPLPCQIQRTIKKTKRQLQKVLLIIFPNWWMIFHNNLSPIQLIFPSSFLAIHLLGLFSWKGNLGGVFMSGCDVQKKDWNLIIKSIWMCRSVTCIMSIELILLSYKIKIKASAFNA